MQSFDYKELLSKFRYPLLGILVGLILLGGGLFFFKSGLNFSGTKVEVLNESTTPDVLKNITAEIAGEVITPGVYEMPAGSRVEDLLTSAGGFSVNADRTWTDKYLNRAAKIIDGQKVYIPSIDQRSNTSSANKSDTIKPDQSVLGVTRTDLVNINTASLGELDSLPGIGQVYGQSIIEHRPYSTVEELLSKGVLKSSVYQKIKDKVSVY